MSERKCSKAVDCMYGSAIERGYCAYDEDMPATAICPIKIDAYEMFPDSWKTIKAITEELADGKKF